MTIQTVLDIDGTVLTQIITKEIAAGVTVKYHSDEDATQPNDVVLTMQTDTGVFEIEMLYSDKIQSAFDNFATISAVDFFKTIISAEEVA